MVAVDLPEVVDWLQNFGVPAMALEDVLSVTQGAVVAVNAKPQTVRLAQRSQPGVRKAHLTQSFHDGDVPTVRYTLAQLLASDPWECVQRQADVASVIKSSSGGMSFVGAGTELTLRFRGPVGLIRAGDPVIQPGECLAAGHFFEIGLANLSP